MAKLKDGAYVTNHDDCKYVGTHWIALYVNSNTVMYLDSFGVEHIPKEIKQFTFNKDITRNIYTIQAFDSIIIGYFVLDLLVLSLWVKSLTDFTDLFSANNFKNNDEILNYFWIETNIRMVGIFNNANIIMCTWLYNRVKFKLKEISRIKYYFMAE